MNSFLQFLLLSFIVSLTLVSGTEKPEEQEWPESVDEAWVLYKKRFDKSYSDPKEDAMRKVIFEKIKKMVDEHNERYRSGKETYSVGFSKFSDRTPDELKKVVAEKKAAPMKQPPTNKINLS